MRRSRRYASLLLFSLVLPIGIAWCSAAISTPGYRHYISFQEDPRLLVPNRWTNGRVMIDRCRGLGLDWLLISDAEVSQATQVVAAVEAGWPFRCLRAYAVSRAPGQTSAGATSLVGGLPLEWDFGVPIGFPLRRTLPILPIWSGLIANMAITAALLLGPAVVRDLLRVRSGRCENCGHQLLRTQAHCPECGPQSNAA
jgi:hypothetical protein